MNFVTTTLGVTDLLRENKHFLAVLVGCQYLVVYRQQTLPPLLGILEVGR
jgi:hypothetical protein